MNAPLNRSMEELNEIFDQPAQSLTAAGQKKKAKVVPKLRNYNVSDAKDLGLIDPPQQSARIMTRKKDIYTPTKGAGVSSRSQYSLKDYNSQRPGKKLQHSIIYTINQSAVPTHGIAKHVQKDEDYWKRNSHLATKNRESFNQPTSDKSAKFIKKQIAGNVEDKYGPKDLRESKERMGYSRLNQVPSLAAIKPNQQNLYLSSSKKQSNSNYKGFRQDGTRSAAGVSPYKGKIVDQETLQSKMGKHMYKQAINHNRTTYNFF